MWKFKSAFSIPRLKLLSTVLSAALFTTVLALCISDAQVSAVRVDYTVKLASLEDHLFHVTTEVKNLHEDHLQLSLPIWTPGWYTIENYAKNILRFKITDSKGALIPHTMTRKQTWRVDTRSRTEIRIEFDYAAEILALNQAKIRDDFAFFTGTQLFLEAEGHRNAISKVRFELPADWKIISALKETSEPGVFTASNYDTLVDSPTLMGNFEVEKFEVEKKPHYFAYAPAGVFEKQQAVDFTKMLAKIALVDKAIFGSLPYEKYVYFYFFASPESNAGGGLEHQNSFVGFAPPLPFATPDRMIGLAAHEFFHLWNVKRLRPAEMWPYDYSRERETPLLWVSEGFTNYYGSLSQYRAGLISRDEFLESVSEAAAGVEGNEARAYISPASSSISTWLGYDITVPFSISYYTQGQNLAALLDLSIRKDTRGAAGLDDLMRALYKEAYLAGRGFTTGQMVATLNRITRKDYHGFFNRYVWGIESPPYDRILGFAGYRFEKSKVGQPVLGISLDVGPQGPVVAMVDDGSPAAEAGLEVGDILLTIDGIEVRRGFRDIRRQLAQKIGQTVKVQIKRGDQEETTEMRVQTNDELRFEISEIPQATPEQLKVRQSWLRTPK